MHENHAVSFDALVGDSFLSMMLCCTEPTPSSGQRRHRLRSTWGLHQNWPCWYRAPTGCWCVTSPPCQPGQSTAFFCCIVFLQCFCKDHCFMVVAQLLMHAFWTAFHFICIVFFSLYGCLPNASWIIGLLCVVFGRPCGCCAPVPVRLHSETWRALLSVLPMNSSTPPR